MDILSLNPYLRVSMQSRLPVNHKIKRRIIFDYELVCVEKGDLLFSYDGTDYHCQPGDLIFICPGIPHSFLVGARELSQPHIHFDFFYDAISEQVPICFRDLPMLSKAERRMIRRNYFYGMQPTPFVRFRDPERFFFLFHSLTASPPGDRPLYKKALLLELIEMLLRDNFPGLLSLPNSPEDSVIRQVREYIDVSFERDFTLDDLEKQFFYSKFYLEKQFRRCYGCSVISYRNEKRVEEAKRLLREHSVTDTASAVGYDSVYSFSRAFRKMVGMSPTEYCRETVHQEISHKHLT